MEIRTVEKQIYVATGKEIAEMLNVSQRRLQQMISEELISGKIGRDQFDVSQVIVTFREYVRHRS